MYEEGQGGLQLLPEEPLEEPPELLDIPPEELLEEELLKRQQYGIPPIVVSVPGGDGQPP